MQELLEPPTRAEQMAFNRQRWTEIVADPALAALPGKVECNAYGNVIMMPPASGDHSRKQLAIQLALMKRLGGFALPECPVSTLDGVRATDVGWYSEERFAAVEGQIAFETAPEICIEVLSPSNTERELAAKAGLYFDAGALEVWLCDTEGRLRFLDAEGPLKVSRLCPDFPEEV